MEDVKTSYTPDGGIFLLWTLDKARVKGNTYMWVSVWWETKISNWGIYESHIHWVDRGTGTPIDKDEVNRRDLWVCDGWVCNLETVGVASMFRLILRTTVLTRMCHTLDLICEENVTRWKWKSRLDYARWTPETVRKRSVSRWDCKNKRNTNSHCRRLQY